MNVDVQASQDTGARALEARDERRGREETVVAGRTSRTAEQTAFLAYSSEVPSLDTLVTPTIADLRARSPRAWAVSPALLAEDAIDRARDARVALLAKKYEGVATTEDDARFAILTARLRKLDPRVTDQDHAALNAIVADLEDASSSLDTIRSKFGLK
jgi:hypothetical protein